MTHGGNYKLVHGRGQWTSWSHGENGCLCHFLVSKYGAIERPCFSFCFCLCFQIGLPIMVILWNLASLPSLPWPPTISWNSCGAVALEPQAASTSCRQPESEWGVAFSEPTVESHRITHTWEGGHLGYGVVLAAESVTSKYLPVLFIEKSDINNL